MDSPDHASTKVKPLPSCLRSTLIGLLVIGGLFYTSLLGMSSSRTAYVTGCVDPKYAHTKQQGDLPLCVPKVVYQFSAAGSNITSGSVQNVIPNISAQQTPASKPQQVPHRPVQSPTKVVQLPKQRVQVNQVKVTNCQELKFAPSNKPFKKTALTSFPGSGNTWIRHLIQQATGFYTGSIYRSPILIRGGFLGERRHDQTVIVIKTHMHPPYVNIGPSYDRAVLLARNPFDALLAEFNREKAGKVGQVPEAIFNTEDWTRYLTRTSVMYREFFMGWLKHSKHEIFIVHYEDLKKDIGPPLNAVVKYLTGKEIPPDILQCIYDNSEGKYHRTSEDGEPFDPYSSEWRQKLTAIQEAVYAEIDSCVRSGKCLNAESERTQQVPHRPAQTPTKAVQLPKQRVQVNQVTVTNCQELKFASSDKPFKKTALTSFPGSGNTWIRHLIQQATGFYTGSIYRSPILIRGGFLGERRHDQTVIVIKTHMHPPYRYIGPSYDRAVLLARNPFDALLAEFNRAKAGKVGQVPEAIFNTEDWTRYLTKTSQMYRDFFMGWLKHSKHEIFIVHYEDLKKDLGPPLNSIVKYLTGKEIPPDILQCIYDNSEGKYHRTSEDGEPFDPYSSEWRQKLTAIQEEVYAEIDSCVQSGKCLNAEFETT